MCFALALDAESSQDKPMEEIANYLQISLT